MFNVLVDAAGTVTCQSVITGLRKAEGLVNRIITIDCDPINAGRFMSDRFYICPKANTKEYIEFVAKLCIEEDIDIFIPIIDSGLLNVSANLDKFPKRTKVIVSDHDAIVKCDNKLLTSKVFKEAELLTPEVFHTVAQVPSDKFPLFTKPLTGGRASINCQKVDNYEEAYVAIRRTTDDLLFMKYVEGQEYTIDTLCDMDGNFIAALPRKRLETKSGVSYKAEIVHNDELYYAVKKLTSVIKIKGPSNIQCIEDRAGNYWFIEINPRFSGTLAASIAAGFNSVEALLSLLAGRSIPSLEYNDGYFIRFWSDVFVKEGFLNGRDSVLKC